LLGKSTSSLILPFALRQYPQFFWGTFLWRNFLYALAFALASLGSAGASTYTFNIQIDLTSVGRVYSTAANKWWS
jgi:hypothetical protein